MGAMVASAPLQCLAGLVVALAILWVFEWRNG